MVFLRPKNGSPWFNLWAMAAAFGTYFCMYSFRKPFTAATYEGEEIFGMDYKAALVTAQLLGYMFSKFAGIRIIAEMKSERRALGILTLIGLAESALLGFALVSKPWKLIFLFCNGFPLGLIFGVVMSYLEGRKFTELLSAGLCASFIVSSGWVKSIGKALLNEGVDPYWMPFATGAMFFPPLIVCVWMLTRIPPPSVADRESRSERLPMSRTERLEFFFRYAPGISLILAMYAFITVVRTFRDDYAVEIWKALGYEGAPDIFGISETLVMFGVVIFNGSAVLISNNRKAFHFSLIVSFLGSVFCAVALGGQAFGKFDPLAFMVLLGLGLYLPYVAVHTTVFERLIALTREKGNIGFLMYLADTVGYLVFAAMLLLRKTIFREADALSLIVDLGWVAVVLTSSTVILAIVYFHLRLKA
jgi:hypothetical protein